MLDYSRLETEILSRSLPIQPKKLESKCNSVRKVCVSIVPDEREVEAQVDEELNDLNAKNSEKITAWNKEKLMSLWDGEMKLKYAYYKGDF